MDLAVSDSTSVPATLGQASRRSLLPFALYGLTGFAGLLAEQGFEKYIALLVGATASASAVVIFAYFLGFALGSLAAGKFLQAGRIKLPLRAYGWIELMVGLTCVVFTYSFHPIVERLAPLQAPGLGSAATFAVRFFFGTLLILPTAALMGASFPLISQVVDREDSSGGSNWALAYGMNLAGAVLACLLGAYWLIPAIGLRGSFWLCAVIGIFVWIASRTDGQQATPVSFGAETQTGPRTLDRATQIMLLAAFVSGLIFFALEILWTHLIATTLGASVYAFSSMLIMVLTGLFIGAMRVRAALARGKPASFSRMFQLSALLLICQLRCWDWIQGLFLVPLPAFLRNFWGVEVFKLGMAAILIVPSAAMLGTIFPFLLGSPVLKRPGNSYLVAYLNTANSVGCLAGALAGIFFLIPRLGSELSLKAMTTALLLLSFLFLWNEKASRKVLIRAVVGTALVLGYTVTWKWNPVLMTSGLNVYFGRPAEKNAAEDPKPLESSVQVVYFDEQAQGGFTTVVEKTDKFLDHTETGRLLLSNGKFQGDDVITAQGFAQAGFAVIPSLFAKRLDRSLLVGMGTGQSANTLVRLGYKRVDLAEFSPGIVGAARKMFTRVNEGMLEDPRVHLYLEDGRNVLLTNPPKYDLITIEITSIWFAGATNLYSKEFYTLADRRLNPDGVLQQWVQLHHISPAEIASTIATVRQVFPYVSLWYFGDQGMIVATHQPQTIDPARVEVATGVLAHFAQNSGVGDLGEFLLSSQLLSSSGVDRMIAALKPVINTDHNRWIEYSTPRYNASAEDWPKRNVAVMKAFETQSTAVSR